MYSVKTDNYQKVITIGEKQPVCENILMGEDKFLYGKHFLSAKDINHVNRKGFKKRKNGGGSILIDE